MKFELIDGGTAIRISDFGSSVVNPKDVRSEGGLCVSIEPDLFYFTQNGRTLRDDGEPRCPIEMIPRVFGGKGGFGSMLRAIGAQIEKTTNRDACRDLSGRRLRDINEEQRLKRWFAKQGEREEERQELRKQKLDRMRKICEGPPLPKTEDRDYNQQRADMAEAVFEAVDKGFEASTSSLSSKPSTSASASASSCPTSTTTSGGEDNETSSPGPCSSKSSNSEKPDEEKRKPEKKMKKTMFDEDLDSDVSSSDEEIPVKKLKTV